MSTTMETAFICTDELWARGFGESHPLRPERLRSAELILARTYGTYTLAKSLAEALTEDVSLRFATVDLYSNRFASDVASAAVAFIEQVAESRNWARF